MLEWNLDTCPDHPRGPNPWYHNAGITTPREPSRSCFVTPSRRLCPLGGTKKTGAWPFQSPPAPGKDILHTSLLLLDSHIQLVSCSMFNQDYAELVNIGLWLLVIASICAYKALSSR
jgi:hypothetical protein